MKKLAAILGVFLISCQGSTAGTEAASANAPSHLPLVENWSTDWSRASINLGELKGGGPGRDGIPPLEYPKWISVDEARLGADEPVILFESGGEARAYPLRILLWHEIINDDVAGVPIAVTFCPLTHSVLVFDRRVGSSTLSFGVSGLLRKSNLVMWDRETESLWQQFVGEAIVGSRTGERLRPLPASLIPFSKFRSDHPDGLVQSGNTGHVRPYGTNPYENYIHGRPNFLDEKPDPRHPPMERVVGTVSESKTEPSFVVLLSRLAEEKEIRVEDDGKMYIFRYIPGTNAVLERRKIADSRREGSGIVLDEEGRLIPHVDAFWFAWASFHNGIDVRD